MAISRGRIPETAFKVISAVAFGVAMIAAVVRALIQLRMRKKPRLDDCLLLFACVLLTASTALLYHEASSIYFAEALVLDLAATPGTGAPTVGTLGLESEDLDKIFDQVTLFQRIDWAYAALTWTAIYSVKFAFLSFFRCLVDRLPRVHRFWKIVGVITALAFAFAVCEGFIACPKLGVESLTCAQSSGVKVDLAVGALAIGLDIITDMLILFIPISLLWRVQMKLGQKLGLGSFLCLNIFMIIMAVIRLSGFRYRHTFDDSWILIWLQLEACIAVTMVSLTAFRSIFVENAYKQHRIKQASPPQGLPSGVFRRQKICSLEDQELANLPAMRAAIHVNPVQTLKSGTTLVSDRRSRDRESYSNEYYRVDLERD